MIEADICIIGGGASGMAAAIAAGRMLRGKQICVLEKLNAPGHKILATGNGRCNLTNMACPGAEKTRVFFRELGVYTREEEDGRVYPWCGDARAVQGALAEELRRLHVQVMTGAEVTKAEAQGNSFLVSVRDREPVRARELLLACGGKAGPKLGTTGDGARLARQLQLRVTPLAPALTAMEVYEDVRDLKGVRARGTAALYFKNRKIAEEKGEIQFTSYGISGICVFNLSGKMVLPPGKKLKNGFDDYSVRLDLADGLSLSAEELKGMDATHPFPLESIVKRPLAQRIIKEAQGDGKACLRLLHGFTLHPKGLKGWDMAQVTRGGVALEELDPDTMEVLHHPGLYVTGELQDWNGPCGGYNLQHAWETGYAAGKAMAERLVKTTEQQKR